MHKKKLVFLSISLLLLLFASFGTTYAFTFDEFIEFLGETKTLSVLTQKQGGNYMYNNYNSFKNACVSHNINLDDYSSFAIRYQTSSQLNSFDVMFYMWSASPTYTLSSNYIQLNSNTTTSGRTRYEVTHRKGGGWEFNGTQSTTATDFSQWALMDASPVTGNFGNLPVIQNYLNYIVCDDEIELTWLPRYMGSLRLGTHTNITPIVKLYKGDTELNNITLELDEGTEVNGGTLYQILMPMQSNADTLISGNDYVIKCYADDQIVITGNIFTLTNSLPNITVIPAGQITNASGDVIGSISVDAIIQAINSGDNALLNAMTNSQVASGEEITINDMPMNILEFESGDKLGQTEEFFTWLLNQLRDVINDTNNVTLDIPIYTTHNYVPSNFFVLPNGALKTFITGGWWFIVGVPFIKYLRSILMTIRSGKVPVSDEKNDLLGNVL